MRNKRKPLFVLATVVIALAGLLAVLEIAVRIGGWGPHYQRFSNQSSLYYTNPRGYFSPLTRENGRVLYGVPFATDSDHLRLPDRDLPPLAPRPEEEGGPSILILGDSFTWGRGVRYPDLYSVRLEKLLRDSGCPARVKNAARVGESLEDVITEYETQEARAWNKGENGDLVVYGFVLNDFGLEAPGGIQGLDFVDFNNGDFSYSLLRDHSALVNLILGRVDRARLHKVTVKAYLDAFKGEDAAGKFALFAGWNRQIESNGQRLVVLLFPLLYDFDNYPFHEIHDKIRALCEREGISLVDLLPAFSRHQARDLWAHPMDHHPNDTAHRIAAGELFRFLESHPGLLPCPPANPPGEPDHEPAVGTR